jgi:hypothetical protein
MEQQHELEFQRSKPEVIQAQPKVFRPCFLEKLQWKALLVYLTEDGDDAHISGAQLYGAPEHDQGQN